MLTRTYVLALSCLFAAHFFLVLISALPLNPIALEFRPAVKWYVSPVFAQNWALFAPNPPETDIAVLARYELRHGDRTALTSWFDVSDALRAEVSHDPLTPLGLFTQIMNRTGESLSNSHAVRRPEDEIDLDAPSAREVASRIAVSYGRTLGLGGEISAVRISLVVHRYPRFTEYQHPDDPAQNSTHFDYGWYRNVEVANFTRLTD